MHHGGHVAVREQAVGTGSLLLPPESQGTNSGHHARWQAPRPTGSSWMGILITDGFLTSTWKVIETWGT